MENKKIVRTTFGYLRIKNQTTHWIFLIAIYQGAKKDRHGLLIFSLCKYHNMKKGQFKNKKYIWNKLRY